MMIPLENVLAKNILSAINVTNALPDFSGTPNANLVDAARMELWTIPVTKTESVLAKLMSLATNAMPA